jgi:transcription initiation factor TFIIB
MQPLLPSVPVRQRGFKSQGGDQGSKIPRNMSKMTPKARRCHEFESALETLAKSLCLNAAVVAYALKLCEEVRSAHFRCPPHTANVATFLYLACRENGLPRTLKEFVKATGISKKDMGRCYNKVQKVRQQLGVDLPAIPLAPVRLSDYVRRFCTLLSAPSLFPAAQRVIERAAQLDLFHGRTPVSVAAGVVLFASCEVGMEGIPQEGFTIAQVHEVTLVCSDTLKQVVGTLCANREGILSAI